MGRINENGSRLGAKAAGSESMMSQAVGMQDPVDLYLRIQAGRVPFGLPSSVTLSADQETEAQSELDRQRDFFLKVWLQAKKIGETSTTLGRGIRGPFWGGFDTINNNLRLKVKQISPDLPDDSLASATYQTNEAYLVTRNLSDNDLEKLQDLRKEKHDTLHDFADTTTLPVLMQQTIPANLLEEPQFCRQHMTSQTCVNACFRMIFGDIAGWYPVGNILARTLLDIYETPLVHTNEYLNIFQTDGFKQEARVGVRALGFEGASFETIAAFAKKLKEKQPDIKTYCMVDLGSEADTVTSTWHANILLGVDEKDVIVHDPAKVTYGASRRIPKKDFARRWAEASNGGYFVIATHKNPPRG